MSYSETITRTDLLNILNEVLPSGQYIETLEYVGNYGQTIFDSSWTATDDGIMIEMLGSNTSGATAYWYINDTTENRPVGCISMNANGTTNSTCFPIIKGHTYSSAAKAAVNSANAYFFKYTLKETVPDSAVDYIVEEGTSGEWTYRKWNSGVAECWRQTGSYSEAMTNNYGNGNYYTTDYFGFPPNLFTSVKYVDVHRVGGNGVGLVSTSVYSYSTTRVDLYIWNNGSPLTTNLAFSIHAIGTWK